MITVRPGTAFDLSMLSDVSDVPGIHAAEWRAFELDGEVVAVWGMLMRWPHVAELCGSVSPRVRGRHALGFVRHSRRMLSNAACIYQLRRITAYVNADEPMHRRFAEGSGFRIESVMYEAGPDGSDLIVYARRFPWGTLSAASSEEERSRKAPPLPLPPQRPSPPHLHLITDNCGRTTGAGPERLGAATTLM